MIFKVMRGGYRRFRFWDLPVSRYGYGGFRLTVRRQA